MQFCREALGNGFVEWILYVRGQQFARVPLTRPQRQALLGLLLEAIDIHRVAFEGELRGVRSQLPDGEDSLHTVATTQAVLQSILERRIVSVSTVA